MNAPLLNHHLHRQNNFERESEKVLQELAQLAHSDGLTGFVMAWRNADGKTQFQVVGCMRASTERAHSASGRLCALLLDTFGDLS